MGALPPEEIDEASLTAFFSYADDELEQIAAHRDIHGRFAIAVAVGALRWLGFVPAALQELPEPAAALIASQRYRAVFDRAGPPERRARRSR